MIDRTLERVIRLMRLDLNDCSVTGLDHGHRVVIYFICPLLNSRAGGGFI